MSGGDCIDPGIPAARIAGVAGPAALAVAPLAVTWADDDPDIGYMTAMKREPPHIKERTPLCANYRGLWVALADDEVTVLAAAPTARAALAASAAKGFSAPILYRVPDSLDTFVGNAVRL